MDILIIVSLLIAGIILLLLEVFLFPGISLAGIGATVCIVYANIRAFSELGTWPGVITLAISIISSILVFVWFMRSKSLDRLALKKDIDSSVKRPEVATIKPGDTGVAITRLAQIGNALSRQLPARSIPKRFEVGKLVKFFLKAFRCPAKKTMIIFPCHTIFQYGAMKQM